MILQESYPQLNCVEYALSAIHVVPAFIEISRKARVLDLRKLHRQEEDLCRATQN